jgi:hypothetical protein
MSCAALIVFAVSPSSSADGYRLGLHGTWGKASDESLEGNTRGFGAEIGLDMGRIVTVTAGFEHMRLPSRDYFYSDFSTYSYYSFAAHSTLALFGARVSPLGLERWGPSIRFAAGLEMRTGESVSSYGSGTNNYYEQSTSTRDGGAFLVGLGLRGPIGNHFAVRTEGGALIIRDTPVFQIQLGLEAE